MTSASINNDDQEKYSRITTSLALSYTVYAKDDQSCLRMLNKQLHNMFHNVEYFLLAKESEVPYLIAYKTHAKEIYVAFRGTENFWSILPSLKCIGMPNEFQGRFHGGYLQLAKGIPLGPFADLLNSNPTCKLIFTGHSLGGAIAAIVTSNLLADTRSIGHHNRILCIAFGAPFFANEQCATYMNEHYQSQFHFYINHSDPIPFVFSFVHDCLQQSNSPEYSKICIDWLKTLLGLQEAAIVNEDQSRIDSRVSDASVSQLSEANSKFKTAIDFFRPLLSIFKIAIPKYELFGEYYHIVTDLPISSFSSSNDENTSTATDNKPTARILVKPQQKLTFYTQWGSMTSESIIDKMIKSYQDHGIRNYISELHTHFIVKSGFQLDLSTVAQVMSTGTPLGKDVPLIKFLPTNDPIRWQHNTNIENINPEPDVYYWSAILTEYVKEKKSNISFRFRGTTVCFFLRLQYCEQQENSDSSQLDWHDAVRHPSLDEDIVIFEIKNVNTSARKKMLYRCVHHFGSMELKNIIDLDQLKISHGLVGRQRQVANFQIIELYLAAFVYVIFNQPSTEEEVSTQTTTYNTALDQCRSRREEIQKALLSCEEIILTDRKQIEQELLKGDKERLAFFQREIENIRIAGARFAESEMDNKNQNNIRFERQMSNFLLHSLQSQFNALSSTSNVQDIIIAAVPTLVTMGHMITDKLETEHMIESILIGACCSQLVATTIYNLGGSDLVTFIFGVLAGTISGYGTYRMSLGFINLKYLTMLEYIAKSLGISLNKVDQRSYWLEKKISEFYQKNMSSYTDEFICKNWKTQFFQRHDLARLSSEQRRLQWLRSVKCVHAHFIMRQKMSEMLTVGVIGVGKVGKSMFLRKAFGFPTQPGAKRTKKVKRYLVSNHFQMLDLPHLTSTYDKLRYSFVNSYTMMNGIIVVLDAQQQGDDEQGEGHALSIVQKLLAGGVEVLYCFNKADILVREVEEANRLSPEPLSDDEDNNDNEMANSSSTEQSTQQEQPTAIWNRETTKNTIADFVSRYEKFGVSREKCELTFFELNERDSSERKRIKERLKSVGILNAAEIRDNWLCNLLKDNGFNDEKIEQVKRFRYNSRLTKE